MSMFNNRVVADQEWGKARRRAFFSGLMTTLGKVPNAPIDFNDIARQLKLKTAVYKGTETIPLDSIVGSVGRYQDFTRRFLPTGRINPDRWKNVAMAYLDGVGVGVPPIEVYKIGGAYFVKDGNHRVSVARQLQMSDIEAHVWEYNLSLEGVEDPADIDQLLIKKEEEEFFRKTRLDDLRPEHDEIRVTVPGGYTDLLYQIARYQQALQQIDERDIPYEEAVTAWYDMLYEVIIQKIIQEGVLELFPERTKTDFYVWITRYHEVLKEENQRPIMVSQAVRDFHVKNRSFFSGRLRRLFRRLLGRRTDDPV